MKDELGVVPLVERLCRAAADTTSALVVASVVGDVFAFCFVVGRVVFAVQGQGVQIPQWFIQYGPPESVGGHGSPYDLMHLHLLCDLVEAHALVLHGRPHFPIVFSRDLRIGHAVYVQHAARMGRLVARFGSGRRILEDAPHPPVVDGVQQIVGPGALVLYQTQLRLVPGGAVGAFGVRIVGDAVVAGALVVDVVDLELALVGESEAGDHAARLPGVFGGVEKEL